MTDLTIENVKLAADVLEEMSRVYEYADPRLGEWSSSDLRREIPHVEYYLGHQKLIDEIADRVADLVIGGSEVLQAVRRVLRDFELTRIAE